MENEESYQEVTYDWLKVVTSTNAEVGLIFLIKISFSSCSHVELYVKDAKLMVCHFTPKCVHMGLCALVHYMHNIGR